MVNVRVDGWDFGPGQLLSPGEVSEMFRVGPATVARWADEGRLSCVRTLGGVRRISREQIEHVKNGGAWGPRKVVARQTVRPKRADGDA